MVEAYEYLNEPLPPELFIEHSDGEPLRAEILAPVHTCSLTQEDESLKAEVVSKR